MSLEDDARIQELMKLGYYDNKMRLVYFHIESPPTCGICGIDVSDTIFITSRSGKVWCIDHAPMERQVRKNTSYTRVIKPYKIVTQMRMEAYR